MQFYKILGAMLCCLMALSFSCASHIVVTHADHMNQNARVFVDGVDEGPLEYGDSVKTRVKEGLHQVIVLEDKTGKCPWIQGEQGWSVWVVDELELTLLPQPTQSKPKESRE